MKSIIAPSILASDQGNFQREVEAALTGGGDWIHVDVMDGHFVPPISFGAGVVRAVRKFSQCFLDVHLMIENPERQIEDFASAGASMITVHVEACTHLHRVVQLIKEHGVHAGVALNPATSLDTVSHVINDIDLLLIMTVNPGWGGQAYIPASTKKVSEAAAMIRSSGREIYLEVDGGITAETARESRQAGANVFVAGTSVFGKTDYSAAIDALRS